MCNVHGQNGCSCTVDAFFGRVGEGALIGLGLVGMACVGLALLTVVASFFSVAVMGAIGALVLGIGFPILFVQFVRAGWPFRWLDY